MAASLLLLLICNLLFYFGMSEQQKSWNNVINISSVCTLYFTYKVFHCSFSTGNIYTQLFMAAVNPLTHFIHDLGRAAVTLDPTVSSKWNAVVSSKK